ncbi:hypothetical protein GH714_008291 [Hevea brasiliensis]|uniref:Fe2OG dioxygenase domain-containing protein n=1 Tax=Hevea brasiliensis TaxID=3981 RepID=A0A6A6M0H3_HEVBR|nr:hypothetical protein GH714_008291 [Hevea brasiliensis]
MQGLGVFSTDKSWGVTGKREKIFNASRKFFAQPSEEKNKIRRDEKRVLGYYDTKHTKNVRDWKEGFDFTAHNPIIIPASYKPDEKELTKCYNQWPDYPPKLREVCDDYAKETERLAFKLMELIALSLGFQPDRFHGFFKEQTTFIRLKHYPPCPFPHLALGVGRHKDAGGLTILAQDDVAGLEVKRKSDGEWIWVKPAPNSYIMSVGDIIQSLSRSVPLLDSSYVYNDGPNNPPTALNFGPVFLSSIMYKLSPIEDYELAITLVRPLRLFSEEDMAKEIVLTTENYGSVRRIFLISEKDEVSKKDFQLWMIQRNPPNEVIEMLGSDHMLMMSKPIELWGHLLSIAEKDS